ncbi:MAG TPA: c-type cytochrome [Vicinamibacterales bacterium]|nr:c-type cytochrome [Vicinamibacterales bacterium]
MRIRTVVSISVPLSLSLFTAVLGLARAGEAFAADAPAAKAPLPPPVIERVMPASGAAKAVTPAPEVGRVLRGKYLVDTGGCGDCHTPLKMPPAPKLPPGPWGAIVSATNTAWAGPWGVSFTANLTPDVGTGLGGWNAKQFADTMRTGKHLGIGREILPPMPIPAYKNFNDADLDAIFAYLQSIPAVKNRVPAPLPPAAPAASSPAKK